jgi:glycosyltransferase involved in cell wall biosynthesis/tetratricopeptide (TPR) repeat protein
MKNNQPSQPAKNPAANTSKSFLLSLIIPCYNESARVDIMLQGLADFEEKWKGNYEVIVVDDGSKDDTVKKIAESIESKYTFLKNKLVVEQLPANAGKGSALKKGVSLANGEYILTLDADMSTKPADLINWERREKGLFSGDRVIYIGSRKHEDGKVEALASRRMIGGVFNGIVQVFTTLQLRDTQCGFKLYPREVAKFLFGNMQSKGWAHDVELLYQADLNGIGIVEMPVNWVNMPESKVNVIKDSLMMLIGVLSISFRIWLYNSFLLPFRIPPGSTDETKKLIRNRSIFNILAILLVLIMPAISFHFSVTGDEHWHFDYGNSIYNYFFNGDTEAQTATSGIQYYGGIFDFITAFVYNVFHPWDHYTTMHFVNAIVGAIGIIYAGKLAKLLGGWNAGILTMVFLVLSPSWFGHNFANPKDIPFSMGYTAGIYFILLFIKSLPYPSARHIVGLIASIGWAMGVRIGGFLLIAYLLLFILIYAVYSRQLKAVMSARIIKQFAIVAVAGYLIAILFWPYAHLGIVGKPLEALKVMSNFFVNIGMLYDGNKIMSNQVPWYYIPKYIMYTAPIIVLLGSAIGLLALSTLYKKNRNTLVLSLLVIFTIVFPLAYAIYKNSSLYDGWRHFLFIYPPLVVIAALGWTMLMNIGGKMVKYAVTAVVILGLMLPARYVVANHPYESLYYNEIAGGLKGIYGRYETDYYMLGIREATNWLVANEHLENKKALIGTNTTYPMIAALYQQNRKNLPSKYASTYERYADFRRDDTYLQFAKEHSDFKDAFNPIPVYIRYNDRYSKDWDYCIMFSRFVDAAQLTSGNWPPEETIHTIDVDGVPIAAILKRKTKKDLAGFELMKAKDYAGAKSMFLESLAEYPGNELVWAEMVRLYEAEGKTDSAVDAGKKVIAKNPGDIGTYQELGGIFIKEKKVDSAINLYKRLEQYSPAYSHFFLAYTYAMTGNANAAFDEIDKSLVADPFNEQAYKLGIQLAQQTRNFGKAEEYNTKAQKAFKQQEQGE